MSLAPHGFAVELGSDGPDHKQWAKVIVTMHDTEANAYHAVSASVLIPEDPEQSIGALKQLAADRAAAMLEAALGLLRAHSAAELKAQQWAHIDAGIAETKAFEDDPGAFLKLT